jgi:DNA-binding NarL/FixJ family response regulator
MRSAEAERARAEGRPEPAAHEAAADAWKAVTRPYPEALMRWRAGEGYVAAGERDCAADVLGRAHAIAAALGAGWLRSEIESLAARARLTLPGAALAAEEPVAAPAAEDPFGLTPRERQVLALVAEGRTNREIGEVLFMAEKTASVHVSRILAKLDVRSRTEAAAVAHRLGLDQSVVA